MCERNNSSEQAQKIAIAFKVGAWSQPWNIDADINKKAAACNLVVLKAIWLHGQGDRTQRLIARWTSPEDSDR